MPNATPEATHGNRSLWWGVALGVAVFVGLALYADAASLADNLSRFAAGALVPALGLVTVGYFVRLIKWEIYLARIGVRLPAMESGLTFFAGMVMSISPGKVGEVLKSFIMKSRHGIAIARTAPIVVAERLTDLVAILLLAGWGVAGASQGIWVIALSALAVGAIVIVFSNAAAGRALVGFARRFRRLAPLADKLAEALNTLRSLLSLGTLLSTSTISVGAWVLECIAAWLILQAFPGVDVDLGTATFIFAFATLAGAVSMLPGGLGLTEGSMIALLTSGFEVMPTVEMATAATLVIRFCTLWYGVVLGALASLWLKRRQPGVVSQAPPPTSGS